MQRLRSGRWASPRRRGAREHPSGRARQHPLRRNQISTGGDVLRRHLTFTSAFGKKVAQRHHQPLRRRVAARRGADQRAAGAPGPEDPEYLGELGRSSTRRAAPSSSPPPT
jgi:hypothetical protein